MPSPEDLTTPHTEGTEMWGDGSISPAAPKLQRSEPIVLNMQDDPTFVQRMRDTQAAFDQLERVKLLQSLSVDELRAELVKRHVDETLDATEHEDIEYFIRRLSETNDVAVWADAFCRQFNGSQITALPTNLVGPVDPGTMIAWFANLVMADRTVLQRASCEHVPFTVTEELSVCRECGADTSALQSVVPPVEEWPASALERMTQIAREEAAKILDARLARGDGQ